MIGYMIVCVPDVAVVEEDPDRDLALATLGDTGSDVDAVVRREEVRGETFPNLCGYYIDFLFILAH